MPSTLIRSTKYDSTTNTLSVWFVGGQRYDYQDVPLETYDGLRRAFAKGHFFNQNIRNRFRFNVVDEGQKPLL